MFASEEKPLADASGEDRACRVQLIELVLAGDGPFAGADDAQVIRKVVKFVRWNVPRRPASCRRPWAGQLIALIRISWSVVR